MTSNTPTAEAGSDGHGPSLGDRLRRWLAPKKLPQPINPALLKHAKERADARQNRIADWITAFAGSMMFVYLHILWFGCWIGFGVEDYPFGLLTMIVSLEAIFLSTFVMISQNRADDRRQVIADQAWQMVQDEDRQNQELLDLSRRILRLTQEVRAYGDTVQEEREQNKELLDVSRQTLALTREVHALSGPARPAGLTSPAQPDQPEGGSAR